MKINEHYINIDSFILLLNSNFIVEKAKDLLKEMDLSKIENRLFNVY